MPRRPTLSTPKGRDLTTRLCDLLKDGNYIETACRCAGLGVSTFYSWMERGEHDTEQNQTSPYTAFVEAITCARAEGEAALVAEVREAAKGSERRPGDWKAAAFVLERGYGERWGPRREVKHSGQIARGEPPVVPETADRLLAVSGLLGEIGALPPGEGGSDG